MGNNKNFFLDRDWTVARFADNSSPHNTPEPVEEGGIFRFHRQGYLIVCNPPAGNDGRFNEWRSAAFVHDAADNRLLGVAIFQAEGPTVLEVHQHDNGDGRDWIVCHYAHYAHEVDDSGKAVLTHYGYWHGDGGNPVDPGNGD